MDFLTFQELLLFEDRVSMGFVPRFSYLLPMMCWGLSRKPSYRDYIQIQSAVIYGSGVLLGRLCGSLISHSTFSSYNETLIVRFVTDGSVTAHGFKARYTVIPHGK